jgi:site-specific recombinase XerC
LRVVEESKASSGDLVGEYLQTLSGRSEATLEAYGQILRQLAAWVAERPGGSDGFRPELLTKTTVEGFLSELEARGYAASYRLRAKSAISGFCVWLIEDKGLLRRNLARGIEIPSQQILAPKRLSPPGTGPRKPAPCRLRNLS